MFRLEEREGWIEQVQFREKRRILRTCVQVREKKRLYRTGSGLREEKDE